jgi:hypothetical protein
MQVAGALVSEARQAGTETEAAPRRLERAIRDGFEAVYGDYLAPVQVEEE